MVEFNDGSVVAQVSATDMRMPIQYALTYPERASAPVPRMDWSEASQWTFEPPDFGKFPLLSLAYSAQETGGTARPAAHTNSRPRNRTSRSVAPIHKSAGAKNM